MARIDAVEEGVRLAAEAFPACPGIVGAVAVPDIEGWVLALCGVRRTESLSRSGAADAIVKHGIALKKTAE